MPDDEHVDDTNSPPEPPSWVALLTLMVHAPDPEPTLRGAIRSWPGEDERAQAYGWTAFAGEPLPVFTGIRPTVDEQKAAAQPIRVWRDGQRLRIEEPDGTINLIVGDTTCWQFDRDHDAPLASSGTALRYAGSGTELLTRREPDAFTGDDFTRPTGPVGATTFLGRPAWTVELAPPPHKPHPLQLVVDAETGIVLQQRNDGFGTVDEWVEFVVGDHLDPALFSWDGPARSAEDQRAEMNAELAADEAQRRRWFTDNVTELPLRVELSFAVLVHEYDDTTGAFQASLGDGHIGMLARRPRSDEPWDLHWAETQHRWQTTRWDWALTFYQDQPTPDGIEALKRQLDPGEH
jgi:hypothetical protein